MASVFLLRVTPDGAGVVLVRRRLEMILQTMQSHMPQLSDAERNMNVELAALDEKLKKMTDDIVQVR